MKTKLSIILTFVLFVTFIITGCSKEDALIQSTGLENTETNAVLKNSATEYNGMDKNAIFDMLEKNNRVLSKIDNYKDHETGATGTLYIIKNNGKTEKWLKADSEPVLPKGIIPERNSVVIRTDWSLSCSGADANNCFGWRNVFLVY